MPRLLISTLLVNFLPTWCFLVIGTGRGKKKNASLTTMQAPDFDLAVLLANQLLSFPHWSEPVLLADTTNQKAEQPQNTETCH